MTLPYERTNAVTRTKEFLLKLCDSKQTPKVPKAIRGQARSLLRHYPTDFDMRIISQREEQSVTSHQIFGFDNFGVKKDES